MSEQIVASSGVGTDDNLFLWEHPFQGDSLIVLRFGCHWRKLVSFCVCLHTRLSVSASAEVVWCTYVQSFCEGFQQLKHRFFGSPLMKLSVPASKKRVLGMELLDVLSPQRKGQMISSSRTMILFPVVSFRVPPGGQDQEDPNSLHNRPSDNTASDSSTKSKDQCLAL